MGEVSGAPRGEHSSDWLVQRNGARNGAWQTRAGTGELRIPKRRRGSYFPGLPGAPQDRREGAAGHSHLRT